MTRCMGNGDSKNSVNSNWTSKTLPSKFVTKFVVGSNFFGLEIKSKW